jgi:uncharacterized protein YgiM (DUF1202 family)
MQLRSLLVAALLPSGLLAAADPDETLDSRAAIVRPQSCAIVGSSTWVNCRTGPGTKYNVRTRLRKGTVHPFWCVVSAQCISVDGSTNWYGLSSSPCWVTFY